MLSLLFVSVAALALDDDQPLTDLPLGWAPSHRIADFDPKPDLGPILDVKLQINEVKDVRQNPTAIGENREDADKPKPVTTKDDVGASISDNLN